MTEKDLIVKLNNLGKVAPDASWLKSNRELLLTQISNTGAGELSSWKVFFINLSSLAKASVQPAYALGVFVFILIFGSLFSNQIFNQVKPNNSLYIARIISEKAKLNTIFDASERDKMAVQFATQHAQEISAVLADPQFNTDKNQKQVAALQASFETEIKAAKDQLSRLDASNDVVSIADSSKDNSNIQVFANPNASSSASTSPVVDNKVAPKKNETLAASSTLKIENKDKALDTVKILDQAKELFNQKAYDQALDKLKEADELIKAKTE